MNIIKVAIASVLMLVSICSMAGESTDSGLIGKLYFNQNSGIIYVEKKTGTWTESGCHTAIVTNANEGLNGFMSMALAAKLAEKEVYFFGNCDTNNNLFDAHTIYIN